MVEELDAEILIGIAPSELEKFLEWRDRVSTSNISAKTLLATDYLNHFNEIVMLIEMVPDMTDMIEDCRIWEPLTYCQHFERSGFSDKALAIAAYEYVPSKFRKPFEDTVTQIGMVVGYTIQRMVADTETGNEDQLRIDCQTAAEMIHRLIQVANGIIHGTTHVMEQEEIDRYLSVS